MPSQQDHFNAARQYQAYYDEYFREIEMKAPEPTLGQFCNDYRRETLRLLKKATLPRNHELPGVNCRGLPPDALQVFEPQFLKAAVKEYANPANVPR
jgi:hypothetical protein